MSEFKLKKGPRVYHIREFSSVLELARRGLILPDDPIYVPAVDKWVYARSIQELRPVLKEPTLSAEALESTIDLPPQFIEPLLEDYGGGATLEVDIADLGLNVSVEPVPAPTSSSGTGGELRPPVRPMLEVLAANGRTQPGRPELPPAVVPPVAPPRARASAPDWLTEVPTDPGARVTPESSRVSPDELARMFEQKVDPTRVFDGGPRDRARDESGSRSSASASALLAQALDAVRGGGRSQLPPVSGAEFEPVEPEGLKQSRKIRPPEAVRSSGSMAGGSMAGGSMAGGSMAGGSMAGGSMAGGSMAGGSMAGGSTGLQSRPDADPADVPSSPPGPAPTSPAGALPNGNGMSGGAPRPGGVTGSSAPPSFELWMAAQGGPGNEDLAASALDVGSPRVPVYRRKSESREGVRWERLAAVILLLSSAFGLAYAYLRSAAHQEFPALTLSTRPSGDDPPIPTPPPLRPSVSDTTEPASAALDLKLREPIRPQLANLRDFDQAQDEFFGELLNLRVSVADVRVEPVDGNRTQALKTTRSDVTIRLKSGRYSFDEQTALAGLVVGKYVFRQRMDVRHLIFQIEPDDQPPITKQVAGATAADYFNRAIDYRLFQLAVQTGTALDR